MGFFNKLLGRKSKQATEFEEKVTKNFPLAVKIAGMLYHRNDADKKNR